LNGFSIDLPRALKRGEGERATEGHSTYFCLLAPKTFSLATEMSILTKGILEDCQSYSRAESIQFSASVYSFINHFRHEFATNFKQELEIPPLKHSGRRRVTKI